jgi:AcrR family transcriptional regulator
MLTAHRRRPSRSDRSHSNVGIGSRHRCLPSKEALTAAIVDRQAQEMSEVVRNALLKVAARPIEFADEVTRFVFQY